jgi:predicted Zn-dependent protease
VTTANSTDRILNTLQTLRQYALERAAPHGLAVGLQYHEEDSALMRFANGAISLNTNEHLIRLEISTYGDHQRASYELITDLSKLDEMKLGIDSAIELVAHTQPLSYQPTIPEYAEDFIDESSYNPALAEMSNAERLAFYNQVVGGLETDELLPSGIFSSGVTISAMASTRSEHTQLFRFSDAQVIAVLAHSRLKWEAISEGSAQARSDLDAARMNAELATLIAQQARPAVQLPLGRYDIVFGPAAIAEMLSFMRWIGFNGGMMRRGYSFLNESMLGQKVFSPLFNLSDDPAQRETYPYRRDFYGLQRDCYPLFEQGIFRGITWMQDDADEFGAPASGHTVMHNSLVMGGGQQDVASLPALMQQPRERDLLFIPYIHYMNIVNPSKAIVTGSSRFGTRLLKQDGSVQPVFNVRLTPSLLDVFGDKVAWLSRQTVAYNVSHSYGRRNPTAFIVPQFMRVNDLEISHSNASD